MRLFLVLALLPAAAFGAVVAEVPGGKPVAPVSPLILTGGSLGGGTPSLSLTLPQSGASLIVPDAPKLILPDPIKLAAPAPLILTAARAMTPEELNPEKPLAGEALTRLTDSLTGGEGAREKGEDKNSPAALKAAFDGSVTPINDDSRAVSASFFASPAEGPSLHAVAITARRLFARLLPAFERPVNSKVRFDESRRPVTGHTWTKEEGHAIELVPEPADARGEVPSAFGIEGMTRVQRKIERLMIVAHERAHVVFDDAVGRKDQHAPDSAYSAMTEGFAVTLERLFVDRLMADPLGWGVGPRDAQDLLAVKSARATWLAAFDNHYSEGFAPWQAALSRGDEGVLAFLAKLSASRMAEVKRSDPAYQLAAHDPELLAAYLGRDASHPLRAGFEAYAKAAAGEELTAEEAKAASAAIEAAGPEGRRRVFERSMRVEMAVKEDGVMPSPERAYALARLSPAGAVELAAWLAATATSAGFERLIGSRGPGPRLDAVVKGAEKLPFTEADHATWLSKMMDFLTKLV